MEKIMYVKIVKALNVLAFLCLAITVAAASALIALKYLPCCPG